MRLKELFAVGLVSLSSVTPVFAADYVIDTKAAHASIVFRFKHLGYSWLTGRFNSFDGTFSYDADNPMKSKVEVRIDVSSIDTNNVRRDEDMRSDRFLDTEKYPTATFVSTRVVPTSDGAMTVYGNLTLHGVTREIAIAVSKVGEGDDPWGGYRAGFEGNVILNTTDFGVTMPPTNQVELFLYVEGKAVDGAKAASGMHGG